LFTYTSVVARSSVHGHRRGEHFRLRGKEGNWLEYFSVTGVTTGGTWPNQQTKNGDHLAWNFQQILLKIVSTCPQTHHVDTKNQKIFLEGVYSLSALFTCGYITGNGLRMTAVDP